VREKLAFDFIAIARLIENPKRSLAGEARFIRYFEKHYRASAQGRTYRRDLSIRVSAFRLNREGSHKSEL
jgi:hypothetical protein